MSLTQNPIRLEGRIMVTKNKNVYCNMCDAHMGRITKGGFEALPHVQDGGYLRLEVHDLHIVIVKYECDYCPLCSKRVSVIMREINIGAGEK